MADIKFEDYRVQVKAEMSYRMIAFLHEAGGEFVSQAARNSRVKTGQTKVSWDYQVDEQSLEVVIGSPLENAIWEELGTGEYALNGDGRKRGWAYQDEKGDWHYTHGKKPNRSLWNAFETLKPKISKIVEEQLKNLNNS